VPDKTTFFKMDRKIFGSDIWFQPVELRIFIYLIGQARFEDEPNRKYESRGVIIEKGQYLKSYRKLQKDLEYIENNAVKNYSLSRIKRTLDNLKEQNRIKTEKTPLGTLFTVVNYCHYQGWYSKNDEHRTEMEQQRNADGTEMEQQRNNTNKGNKGNNVNKDNNKEHCPAEKKQDIPYKEIINYLNKKIGSRYKSTTKKTKKLIKARWNEGFRLDDFKTVIDKKCVEWIGDKEMEKYLRPPTLFSNKFESYLNQLSVENENKGGNDNRNSERNNRNEQQKDYTAGAPEGFFKD
jgi:uncharacterized phage protein (TIGR02220 family)